MTENIAKYGRVIVCLNGDAMNMGIALQIVEVARSNGKSVDPVFNCIPLYKPN